MKNPTYTVQAAASYAGISPHTLRAWETRYAVVVPLRSPSGHRMYRRDDVDRLQRIASLVRRGHAIGQICALPNERLDELLSPSAIAVATPMLSAHAAERLDGLLAAIVTFDVARVVLHVKWLRAVLGVRDFVLGVAQPVFSHLGWLVDRSAVTISQEHALSSVMRDQVGDALHSLQALSLATTTEKSKPIVFAAPEGDMHEFGVMLGALLASSYGLPVYFAGANLPAPSLAEAAVALGSTQIILGNAPVPPSERRVPFKEYLDDLDARLSPEASIWIGGAGDRPTLPLGSRRSVAYLSSLSELDALLMARAS